MPPIRPRAAQILAAALLVLSALACSADSTPEYHQRLSEYVEHQLADKQIPAFSLALVDGQDIVYARGFGQQSDSTPATADTIYRVGSISKLYTDIAVMQLVEQGKLDLDEPVTTYLPNFRPQGVAADSITLRHLMAHRSGLLREPPVGSYFDDSEPAISEIVASLNDTQLVYPPGQRQRYSNAALVTVGAIVQSAAGRPFAEHLETAVLRPLGMTTASFARTPTVESRVANALMWSYDGREFPAPTFDCLVPAGNLYSSVTEQALLIQAIFRDGAPSLEPESLPEMLEPQFGDESRFGLGFILGDLDGHPTLGHSGAVYGFSSELRALPGQQIGVASSAARDVTNDAVSRINDYALRLLLAHRSGEQLPDWPHPVSIDESLQRQMTGIYRAGDETIRLVRRDGDLISRGVPFHGVPIRRLDDKYVFDGRLASGSTIEFHDDAVTIRDKRYERITEPVPPPPPPAWRGLIGEYGWDHNTLFILERDGQLHALIEWVFLYPLTELDRDKFAFPGYGLYHGEHILFERDATGRATAARAASILFPRRAQAEDGATFQIDPVKPIDTLRAEALAASPPAQPDDLLQPDLVEITQLDPTIQLDIRYATTNNFMAARFYREAKAYLQRPAAEAVVRVHQKLSSEGYGLLIHDAYRPWYVTKMFWDATPQSMKHFVANPANGSVHNRGAAVDLTLFDRKTGQPVDMVSGYDEFSERAYPDYLGGTSRQRWHRELLRQAMESEGFEVYEYEWWHFNHKDAQRYPVLSRPFDEIQQNQ